MTTLDELKLEAEEYNKIMPTSSTAVLFHYIEGEQLIDERDQKKLWDHIQAIKDGKGDK